MTDRAETALPLPPPWGGSRFRRVGQALAFALLAGFVLFAVAMVMVLNAPDFPGEAIHAEFSVFWAAAKLSLAGDWPLAWDPTALNIARSIDPSLGDDVLIWSYPPHFLLMVAPLGALPFSAAWILFDLAILGAYAWAVRGAARGVPGLAAIAIGAPAVALCLVAGQNALLTTALLVGFWEALRTRNAVLAGLLAALLSIKPQLCLLIPVALIALGAWRTIGWGAVFFAALVAVTQILPGTAAWEAFFASSAITSVWLSEGVFREDFMVTWYATLTVLGLSRETALMAQAVVTLGVAVVVFLAMRSRAGHDAKGAVLCLGVPLAIPYGFHYELTLAVAAALYLVRAGIASGWRRGLPVLLWLAPLPGLALVDVGSFAYVAPLLTLCFAVTVVACRAQAPDPQGGDARCA